MLEKEKHIKEVWDLAHKHDSNPNKGFDYENKLFERTLSPVILRNETNKNFLTYLQDMMVVMFESVLEVRNLFNYTVDRHYNGHSD